MATNCIKKLVIDTDPGLDDTQAIMMALAHQDVEILALTTVAGNVGIEKVTQNALKVLTVCGRLDIPIYRGASHSILGKVCEASPYHGNDGFGDVADDIVVDTSLVEKEHAAMALINLVNKYPGEITLVTLAPLTNIALAIRLDPTFGSKLKDCYMMGGNIEGRGNVTTSAEFNFHADPEAAYIVLKELRCPITIATWELCLRHSLPWEWYDIFTEQDHCKARFIKSHETNVVKDLKDQNLEYVLCDQFAMAFLLDEAVIEESFSRHATVEMKGEHTRGQVVIDHGGKKQQEQNVRFVTKANMDMVCAMLNQSVKL